MYAIEMLSGAISTLLAGLPLWVLTWRPMQAETLTRDEAGEFARRSIIRRTYLYLVIFGSVIGGMISAIWLFYTLLYAALAQAQAGFLRGVLNGIQLLAVFGGVLAYHRSCLGADGDAFNSVLSDRYGHFPVLVLEQAESGFAAPITESIKKSTPTMPVAAHAIEQGIPEDAHHARVVILPSSLAVNPPEALRLWLKDYEGQKLVLPVETPGWYWPGGALQNNAGVAAQAVRHMAEGQEIKLSAGTPAWRIVAYVFAILFSMQVLFFLLALGISLVSGF